MTKTNIIKVKVKRLDQLENIIHSDVSLIKLDVEGHELSVLKGAETLIMKSKPIILFEHLSDEINEGTSPVIKDLLSKGYEMYVLGNNFYFGPSIIGKSISFLLRSIFGHQKSISRVKFFEKRFYEMVIALPKKTTTI